MLLNMVSSAECRLYAMRDSENGDTNFISLLSAERE